MGHPPREKRSAPDGKRYFLLAALAFGFGFTLGANFYGNAHSVEGTGSGEGQPWKDFGKRESARARSPSGPPKRKKSTRSPTRRRATDSPTMTPTKPPSKGSSPTRPSRTIHKNFTAALENTVDNARLLQKVSDSTWPMLKTPGSRDPKYPYLDFVKLSKVGGTSVANALDHVSAYYDIPSYTLETKKVGQPFCDPANLPAIIYHHHSENGSAHCFTPAAPRYLVTVIREPTAQVVSRYSWWTNRKYFLEFDEKKKCSPIEGGGYDCDEALEKRKAFSLKTFLGSPVLFKKMEANARSKHNCFEMCTRIGMTGKRHVFTWAPQLDLEQIKSHLKSEYLLVGVTKYLDHFIVLLGLFFNFDLNHMLYLKCKSQHGSSPSIRDLNPSQKATVLKRIGGADGVNMRLYLWAKERFEKLLKELGKPFQDLVDMFKEKVHEYQTSHRTSLRWQWIEYRNNKHEWC